jgi:RNA polymerase sigma-70 factor, ECF subfamily
LLEPLEGLDDERPRAALDFEGLYREHGPEMSRWVRRLWGRRDAEDVLHDVLLVVQRRLPEFRRESTLKTWLYGLTARVVIDRRRKERWRRLLFRRALPELQLERSSAETPLHGAEREQAARIVYSILDQLSERDRMLLIMFELEDLPIAQIGEVLAISENNAWVSLHRARARFRKIYAARYGRQQEARRC